MAVSTEFDSNSGLRIHTVTGSLSFDTLTDTLAELYQDARFRADQDALWDPREASLAELTADEVRRVIELVRNNWATEGTPRAALVVAREVDFGMARMYELQLSDLSTGRVQVFRNMEAAREWLANPDPGP